MKRLIRAAALAAALALMFTGCSKTAVEEAQVAGGYTEQRIELPNADFYCTNITPNADGSVTLYGAESAQALYRQEGWQGGAKSYQVQPDGTVSEQAVAWDEELAAACADDVYVLSMATDENGVLYLMAARQSALVGQEPFRLWRVENGSLTAVPVDFSSCELVPPDTADPGVLCTLAGVSEGWIFVEANIGRWAIFGIDGKLVNQSNNALQAGQSRISFQSDAVRSGYVWSGTDNSSPAWTLPDFEKASSLSLPMGRIFPDWQGDGFFHLSSETNEERVISHYTLSGSTREILMHGGDYAWGPSSTDVFIGCAAADGSLWLVVQNGGQQTLYRYVYDPDKAVENTLTIFSLEESTLIRQTIAAWNTLHPEIRVEYTVGMTSAEGTAATREDVIRQLNTRLLAGEAPDLLILDGLSADSMIRQGLLTDLTDLADWSAVRDNVLASYTSGNGLYAVPAGIRVYITGGRPGTVDERLQTLEGIASALEENSGEMPCMVFSPALYEHLFDLFYPASADAIWQGGTFQPDAFTDFTSQLNRIARAVGAQTIQAYNTATEDSQIASGEALYSSFGSGNLNSFWNGECLWFAEAWESADQAIGFGTLERDGDGRLSFSSGEVTLFPLPGVDGNGVFEPLCAAALPVGGSDQDLAVEFIQLMLSDQMQSAAALDVLPVTQSGLAAALDRVRETDPFTITNDENALMDSLTAVLPDNVLQQAAREAAAQLYDGTLTASEACNAVEKAAALRLAEQQ